MKSLPTQDYLIKAFLDFFPTPINYEFIFVVAAVFSFPSIHPGQVYSINTDAKLPFKPPRYGQFGDGGNKSKNDPNKIRT